MEKILIGRELDPTFKYEIASRPGGENLQKCFACGTCTAGCPVFQVEQEYNPRRLVRMILLGMRKEVLSSKVIWLCAQCYACTANCPQEVDFSNIMMRLRDMAVAEGYAPAELLEKIEAVSTAAHEFRRDAIHLLLQEGKVSREDVLARARAVLQQILDRG
jgi:heterodisulfide reductase subunit C